jgi:hypothetical protein
MNTELTEQPKCLRRYADGETIGETERTIERKATDDEIMKVWRVPSRWSYVVRDPSGAISCMGDDDTQATCLNHGTDQVVQYAIERSWPDCEGWEEEGYRFLLWPPERRLSHD